MTPREAAEAQILEEARGMAMAMLEAAKAYPRRYPARVVLAAALKVLAQLVAETPEDPQ